MFPPFSLLLKLSVLSVLLSSLSDESSTIEQVKPGCQSKCGNISIPYPFGIGDCSYDEDDAGKLYYIVCNTTYDPPKPFIGLANYHLEILSITETEFRIKNPVIASKCYDDKTGKLVFDKPLYTLDLRSTPFTFSYTKNMFVGIGCNTDLSMKGDTQGCISTCMSSADVVEGSCNDTAGCCQRTIPKSLNLFEATVSEFSPNILSFSPCNFGFLVEIGEYAFQASDLLFEGRLTEPSMVLPLVLDWAIAAQSCEVAKVQSSIYACKKNSFCSEAINNPGYRCACHKGYEGNPYLGCKDANECEDRNPCSEICTNTNGGYNCSACPEGSSGDGMKHGSGCTIIVKPANARKEGFPVIRVALGFGLGFLLAIVCSFILYISKTHQILFKTKEKFFKQNGGLLLRKQLTSNEGSIDSTKIFREEELKLATNSYHATQVLGKGGFGTVYKGTLSDNRVVAIKKSNVIDQTQIEQFVNEVVILTQINHRNVVKLLGCCLETEVPLLVYEFVSNGTLFQHIHSKGATELFSMTWESRLKIATEVASAIAYLHSAASPPIIHRDIKSTNVLLDENYTAKVSDFGASRLVPLDHTRLNTLVQGTLGYLDPEYFNSSQLTDKSDVYSFGVLLLELLTGEKPLCFERPEEQRNLATYFVSLTDKNDVFRLINAPFKNVGNQEQVLAVTVLAKKCLNWKGKDRPTMKQVAADLLSLTRLEPPSGWDTQQQYYEDTTSLLSEPIDLHSMSSNSVNLSSVYSLDTKVVGAMNNPR
ncbi:hypothetical protein MKX03_028057 [Papaver bracteatum]|nr:hypothetical protein MKX03_028057 [Papaver bracteatum]